jgi:hypothetical protein
MGLKVLDTHTSDYLPSKKTPVSNRTAAHIPPYYRENILILMPQTRKRQPSPILAQQVKQISPHRSCAYHWVYHLGFFPNLPHMAPLSSATYGGSQFEVGLPTVDISTQQLLGLQYDHWRYIP